MLSISGKENLDDMGGEVYDRGNQLALVVYDEREYVDISMFILVPSEDDPQTEAVS